MSQGSLMTLGKVPRGAFLLELILMIPRAAIIHTLTPKPFKITKKRVSSGKSKSSRMNS
jgi:hypothetical protein